MHRWAYFQCCYNWKINGKLKNDKHEKEHETFFHFYTHMAPSVLNRMQCHLCDWVSTGYKWLIRGNNSVTSSNFTVDTKSSDNNANSVLFNLLGIERNIETINYQVSVCGNQVEQIGFSIWENTNYGIFNIYKFPLLLSSNFYHFGGTYTGCLFSDMNFMKICR